MKQKRHVEKALDMLLTEHPESCSGFIALSNVETPDNIPPVVSFTIQSAPIGEVGVNGCQALDMLKYTKCLFKSLNNAFPCTENAVTILNIESAILAQELRTTNRVLRNVEGKNSL